MGATQAFNGLSSIKMKFSSVDYFSKCRGIFGTVSDIYNRAFCEKRAPRTIFVKKKRYHTCLMDLISAFEMYIFSTFMASSCIYCAVSELSESIFYPLHSLYKNNESV